MAAVHRVPADHQPRVVDTRQHLAGVVLAAVVNDHQLDLARVADIEHPLDRQANGRRLVVGGHQDRQLHVDFH
jgi:uncharacterized protein YllA (UPF0747 family)